jgi:Histidine kinase-, DNA gyrase B-, and HSP90-like ATPase
MPPERFERTNVWKKSLAEQKKDDHSVSRDRLRQAFLRFRERAAQLAAEIPQDLPFFTVHDVTHLDALWEMVDLVAGPEYPITPTEAFVLGGAILVHDLAMSQAAYQDEFDKIKKEPIWRDTVSSLLRTRLGRTPTTQEISNPDDQTERSAIQNLLRELHARQAAVLLKKEWGYGGTKYYLLDDADLRTAFANDIGVVAFSHHLPLDKLLDPARLPQTTSGGPGWLPNDWSVDLVKLCCVLRTADAIHCDDRRAPGFIAALRQPTGYSDQHWKFQSLLRTPYLESGADRIRYRSSRPFNLDEYESWWVAFEWLRMTDGELHAVDALLADTNRQRFVARGVANTDHASRLALDLRTEGWEPVDAEIRIKDVPGLVRMLGGHQLYGNRPEVPLRELIQNAADAIRARRKLQGRDIAFGKIVVRPGRDATDQQDWIEVEDNGVGMSKTMLTGTLLDFGTSFWNTSRMRQEFPGLDALGMEATGKFGIGFFAVFMWGDHIRVTTRRYDRGYDETWVLEFLRGVHVRPLLRRANPEEQRSLPDGGTRVRVWCDASRQVPIALLRKEHPSSVSCTWVELCEWLAPALDVSIDVEEAGIQQATVLANDWLTIDLEKLLYRLNRKSSDIAVPYIQQNQEYWQAATKFLGVVQDENGQPVGRGTVWAPEMSYYHESCAVCGGLRTDAGAKLLGIRFSDPDTAARHGTQATFHRAGWKKWAEEQAQFDRQIDFPPLMRALAASRLIPLVHPGDLPFGLTEQRGWVTIQDFAKQIVSTTEFQCIASSFWAAPKLLQNSKNILTVVVHAQYALNQIDGGGFAVVRLLQETAATQWGTDCLVSDLNQGMGATLIDEQMVTMHTIKFMRQQ